MKREASAMKRKMKVDKGVSKSTGERKMQGKACFKQILWLIIQLTPPTPQRPAASCPGNWLKTPVGQQPLYETDPTVVSLTPREGPVQPHGGTCRAYSASDQKGVCCWAPLDVS